MESCLAPERDLYQMHLKSMETHFIIPIENFIDKEIGEAQKAKFSLKSAKGYNILN